jgi:hypothetical protein
MAQDEGSLIERNDRSISLGLANLIVVLASIPIGVGLYLLYSILGGRSTLTPEVEARGLIVFLASLIAGITLHEVLHALGWIIAGRLPVRRVGFGFKLRTLSPYAHLRGTVPARIYRVGVLLPLLALGLAPYLLGILFDQQLVMIYGLFFILAAGGDLLVLWLLRGVPGETMVEDHPSRAGCVVHSPH